MTVFHVIKKLAWLWYLKRNIDSRHTFESVGLVVHSGMHLPKRWMTSKDSGALSWLKTDTPDGAAAYCERRERNRMLWG